MRRGKPEREREVSVWKRERAAIRENDRRGRRKGKERLRKTTPERLRSEPTAPSQPSSSSLPVCFAMVTRQGFQCSQLMCFSAAEASWVLMCLSLSPAQSMSTVLGCTNTWRGCEPGNTEPPWLSVRLRVWKRTTSLPFIHLITAGPGALWSSQKNVTNYICVLTCWSLLHASKMFILH